MIFAVCLSGLDMYEWGTALRRRPIWMILMWLSESFA